MLRERYEKTIAQNPFMPIWQVVYKSIYHEIVTVAYKPGHKIKELQIAEELGVSRSPVHQAIDQLITDGLVMRDTGKSCVVVSMSRQEYIDLYNARLCIEGPAAYRAAKNITEEQLEEMGELCKKMNALRDGKNLQKYPLYDDRFHQIIIDACGNPIIAELYSRIRNRLLRYRYRVDFILTDDNFKYKYVETVTYHETIYNALKSRMSLVAQNEVENDIHRMLEGLAKSNTLQ